MGKYIKLLLLALVVVSCGTDGQHFKIDGRLLHFNQGEFYVYSPDGDLPDMDTIKVEAGRFTYELRCTRPMTLMIVFPNFTEQPVFAEPGKTVELDGSASNLKELKVKGTDDNKLMNAFREQAATASPPEQAKYAKQFIEDHPESAVGSYLVRKYFIQTPNPDYATAAKLLALMLQHQQNNGYLRRMQQQIQGLGHVAKGQPLPAFTARDINGQTVSSTALAKSPTAILFAWSSWNYESMSMLRMLNARQKESQGQLAVVGISLDASTADCRQWVKTNHIEIPVVCDGQMIDGTLFRLLEFGYVPDNIVVKNGRIADRNLDTDELRRMTENL